MAPAASFPSPPPTPSAATTQNISSTSSADAEVAGVAAELRTSLKDAYDKQDAAEEKKHEDFISLGKKHPHTEQLEDTIYIDKDGSLTSNSDQTS